MACCEALSALVTTEIHTGTQNDTLMHTHTHIHTHTHTHTHIYIYIFWYMYLYIIDVYISIYFNKKYNYLTSEIKYLSLKVSSEKLKIKSIFLNDFFMPNLQYHLYFAIFLINPLLSNTPCSLCRVITGNYVFFLISCHIQSSLFQLQLLVSSSVSAFFRLIL